MWTGLQLDPGEREPAQWLLLQRPTCEFAIEAVQENAEALRYATDGFQNDRGFALQRLSQPSEAAIGYLNLPRWLSQRFCVQRGVCGSIPASVQSKGKGVWLFPPLGSPAFPSGVGPLVSLLPAKAIRAMGVCVVDAGPAGSDRKKDRKSVV